MDTRNTILLSLVLLCILISPASSQTPHREYGWYRIEKSDTLSTMPIVTVKDFVGLQLEKDMKGAYVITGRISKHKRHKWATETGRAIGRQFAFVLNDSIISTPHVITQIDDGSFMIFSEENSNLEHFFAYFSYIFSLSNYISHLKTIWKISDLKTDGFMEATLSCGDSSED